MVIPSTMQGVQKRVLLKMEVIIAVTEQAMKRFRLGVILF
jgi:hypothetical protein